MARHTYGDTSVTWNKNIQISDSSYSMGAAISHYEETLSKIFFLLQNTNGSSKETLFFTINSTTGDYGTTYFNTSNEIKDIYSDFTPAYDGNVYTSGQASSGDILIVLSVSDSKLSYFSVTSASVAQIAWVSINQNLTR